MTATCLVLVR